MRIASIRITSSEKRKLARYLMDEIIEQVYGRIIDEVPFLNRLIKESLTALLLKSPEVEKLKSNDSSIRYTLGVLESEIVETVNEIINRVSSSVFLEVKKRTKPNVATLKLGIVKRDYSDLFSIPTAHFISTGKSQADIPWLRWLLTMGDTVIFNKFHVLYLNKPEAKSRTGFAFMVKNGPFRVTPFGGTEENNFITRALNEIPIIVNNHINEILK